MPLARFWLKYRRWRLETLSDFLQVTLWLEEERKAGRGDAAFDKFLSNFTPIVSKSVQRYGECLRELDAHTQGVYSVLDPARNARIGLPEGVTLLANMEKVGAELQPFLDEVAALPPAEAAAKWRAMIGDMEQYRVFVTKLVQHYGNFELVAMSLPGMGAMTSDDKTQTLLREMYRINTRLIRLFDMAFTILRAWQSTPPKPSLGFFEPRADVGALIRNMLMEYMVEADPERIAIAAEKARKQGRRPSRYRFWRPAETLRQMARVEYDSNNKRKPKPHRQYVTLDVEKVPTLCVDLQRLEWAFKEVFNNAIAATTTMTVNRGMLVAKPLERHAIAEPPPVIHLEVKTITKRQGLFNRKFVRLVIADDGVGMEQDLLENAPLWAYSTRRSGSEEKQAAQAAQPKPETPEDKELLIGGKGIGLPFAMTTIREHGGEVSVSSEFGKGSKVILEIPIEGSLQM